MIAAFQRASQLGLLAFGMVDVRCRRGGLARDRTVRRIVDRLGLMHGLPQKIGQLLSFAEFDADPAQVFRLTEQGSPMSACRAFAAMERELGRPLDECFAAVERKANAASLGQVHRARLPDGRDVAIKNQYPDIADPVEWDLRAFGWLTEPVGLRRGFNLAAYRAEIGDMLRDELDYTQEAANLRRFAAWTRGWPGVVVPGVLAELSGPRILTMTWIGGEPLTAARSWPPEVRRELSQSLLDLLLHGCFRWHCLHAAPHSGNLRWWHNADGARLGLLDFGCVKQLSPEFVAALGGLFHTAQENCHDEEAIWGHFPGLGFNREAITPMKALLPAVAKVLVEPFRIDGPFAVASRSVGEKLAEILGSHRMAFRLAGPFELVFFLRAFYGLVWHLAVLDAPVNWQAALGSLVETVPPECPAVTLAPPILTVPSDMKSELLHIEVTASGESLSFGAGAVDNLPDLVPMELREKLQQRAINLTALAQQARHTDHAPGEIFSLQDGDKTVRVWLA